MHRMWRQRCKKSFANWLFFFPWVEQPYARWWHLKDFVKFLPRKIGGRWTHFDLRIPYQMGGSTTNPVILWHVPQQTPPAFGPLVSGETLGEGFAWEKGPLFGTRDPNPGGGRWMEAVEVGESLPNTASFFEFVGFPLKSFPQRGNYFFVRYFFWGYHPDSEWFQSMILRMRKKKR